MKNIIIVDDFYEHPHRVRELGLTTKYILKENLPQEFAGTESVKCFYNQQLVKKIEAIIGKSIEVNPKSHSFGVFSKSFENDASKRQVHVDGTDWTGIVYLSRPEDCKGGTSFFRHLVANTDSMPSAGPDRERVKLFTSKDKYDLSAWEQVGHVGMKFNRLLLFRSGTLFHRAGDCFGTTDQNARLLQLFFFNERAEL